MNESVSYLGDDDEGRLAEKEREKYDDLRNKAQKLKDQKRQKKEQSKNGKVPKSTENLSAFFNQEKNLEHLPTPENQLLSGEDEQNLLGSGSNNSNPSIKDASLLSNNGQADNQAGQNSS